MIAPFGKRPRRLAEFLDRTLDRPLFAPGEPGQRPTQHGRRLVKPCCEPFAEDAIEERPRVRVIELAEVRIDTRLDGSLTEQVRTEGVDGADECAVERP